MYGINTNKSSLDWNDHDNDGLGKKSEIKQRRTTTTTKNIETMGTEQTKIEEERVELAIWLFGKWQNEAQVIYSSEKKAETKQNLHRQVWHWI